jgi:hypothetical protein
LARCFDLKTPAGKTTGNIACYPFVSEGSTVKSWNPEVADFREFRIPDKKTPGMTMRLLNGYQTI